MNSIKGIIDSFKEFIWDIIGYLLPGSYILILLSVCINEKYFLIPSLGDTNNNFLPFIFIVVSYLLGHIAYGFGSFKEKLLSKYSYLEKIEKKVEDGNTFAITKKIILKSLQAKEINKNFNSLTVKELRGIVMSLCPEHDNKIYTFTFRSDLSNQTANISLIIGFVGLMLTMFSPFQFSIFKTDMTFIILYLCLILCYFFLRYTRNRFYEISIGLPFSIYISKAIKL